MEKHIERDMWKPCSICGEYEVFIFEAWYDKNQVGKLPGCKGVIFFCPWCGRPLTEESWKELEKRVRGEK